jgi:hypothetical protein
MELADFYVLIKKNNFLQKLRARNINRELPVANPCL